MAKEEIVISDEKQEEVVTTEESKEATEEVVNEDSEKIKKLEDEVKTLRFLNESQATTIQEIKGSIEKMKEQYKQVFEDFPQKEEVVVNSRPDDNDFFNAIKNAVK